MSFASSIDDVKSLSVVRLATLLPFGARQRLALRIRPTAPTAVLQPDASAIFVYVCTQE